MSTESNERELLFTPDKKLIRLFIDWLEQFDEQHARNWGLLYNDNPEAAMCEATFWGILTDCGVEVEPNCDLRNSSPAPDFFCRKNGFEFYLEATCILIETATSRTGLQHPTQSGASHYSLLNGAICNECIQKTRQCASVDAPCILGIGTFHTAASAVCVAKTRMEWLLTGEQSIAWGFDPTIGQAVGEPYSVTELRCATFFNRLTHELQPNRARSPISALLVGGFAEPPDVYGLLHPEPIHEFDRGVLDRIEFCRLRPDYREGEMNVEWV